jgi:hypothetical protein
VHSSDDSEPGPICATRSSTCLACRLLGSGRRGGSCSSSVQVQGIGTAVALGVGCHVAAGTLFRDLLGRACAPHHSATPFGSVVCALHCIALHCIALHGIALHCVALRCVALRCIAAREGPTRGYAMGRADTAVHGMDAVCTAAERTRLKACTSAPSNTVLDSPAALRAKAPLSSSPSLGMGAVGMASRAKWQQLSRPRTSLCGAVHTHAD